MIDQINTAGELWWSWMWPMFWQVGVLVGLVAAIDLLIRRRVWPQVRYALWLLVLAKLILPPTFSLSTSVTSGLEPIAEQIISVDAESAGPVQTTLPYIDVSSVPAVIPQHNFQVESSRPIAASEGAATPAAPAVKKARISAKGWAMCVWLLGVTVLSVWLAVRFRQLRRSHAAKGDGATLPDWLKEAVSASARKLKLRRLPRIIVSREIASPAVFGVLRPTLLLPSRHLAKGVQKDTEHVLLHELAHIKRGDLWVHAVYMVLQIVHWFNPLLWLVRRRLQHLRELCCDASVAWILREQTGGYRQTILDTAKRLLARPIEPGIGLLGLFEDSSRLLIRLKWLEKKTWRYRTLRIAVILAVIIFMTACILPMAKGGPDVKLSAEELVARIIESEKEIRSVELHYDYVHKDGYVGASFDWGYQHPREYYFGTAFYRAREGRAAYSIEKYVAFDGQHGRNWTGGATYTGSQTFEDRLYGRIRPLRPEGSMFSYPRPTTLLGYNISDDRRSFGQLISEADDVAIKSYDEEIDGHECYLLEAHGVSDKGSTKDIRAWIDPQRGFRPLRIERYESSEGKSRWKILRNLIDNIKLEKIGGVWFPVTGSRGTYLTKDRLPPEGMSRDEFAALPAEERRKVATYKMELYERHPVEIKVSRAGVRINEGIAAKKFAPEFPKGCNVSDDSTGNTYVVGEQSEKDAALSDDEMISQVSELSVAELIEILRLQELVINRKKFFAAVYRLREIGSPAVGQLVEAMRQAETPITQSKLALTLRAIEDPNAVPGLIDALKRSTFSNDFGIGLAKTELDRFYEQHQLESKWGGLGLGPPVREITVALEKLTGHSEGHDHFEAHDSEGKRLKKFKMTPEIRDRQRAHRIEVAQKWRIWWEANKDDLEGAEKTPPPPEPKSSGQGMFFGGPLKSDRGVELTLAVVPNIGDSAPQPSLSDEEYQKHIENLAEEGPRAGSIRGDSFQWSPIDGEAESFKGLPLGKYRGRTYILLCARAEYVMRPEVEGTPVWGLEKVEAASDINGSPAINIRLDDKGAELLGKLTKENIDNRLAIAIDGSVRTAPAVRAEIRKAAIITGDFTADEARLLAEDLKKGMYAVQSNAEAMAGSVVESEAMKMNWPSFRGPGGGGVCADANAPDDWDGPSGKGILWKSAVPLPGNNSPVVWGDRVFVSGGKGEKLEVYCFDGSSGKLLWTGDVPMRRAGITEEFEPMKDTGLAAPTMVTDGERVFAIFASGDLACFDFSGRRLWTKMLGIPDNSYGHASSLAIYRNLLIVQFDQGDDEDGKSRIIAFDTSSGSIVWEVKRPVANSWASPIIAGVDGTDALITCSDPWVIAYAPAGGNELWRAKCLKGDIAPSPVYSNGLAFVVEPYSKIVAIRTDGRGDVTKTHIAWSADEPGPDICSPVSNGKFVFLLNTDGLALCFNAADGKKLWEEDIKEDFFASPSLVGEKLYLLTEKGEMIIAEAAPEYKELKRCKLGERGCRASPAFAGGKIYIRGVNNLYCIGGTGPASALSSEAGEEIDHKADESAGVDFDELSVKFRGIWLRVPGAQFTIKPDGAVEFSANKGPNDEARYTSNFKLRREHLAQLGELLKKTNWLTAPGANVHPGYTDATRIDITLTRDDEVRNVWCHDRNPEPYLSLVNFLKRINRQESLLYRMVADGGKDRAMAFFELGQQIRAQEGEPIAVNPNHVLDLNRFVPPSLDVITRDQDNHHEAIKTALKLLGKLHIEQARERITYLTTAEQKARGQSGASYCTEFIRSAAVAALINLGGQQARTHIRGMAANHASWQRQVNEAVVEGLLKLDRDNCAELLKNMVPNIRRASWGLIRLGPQAMPTILEVLRSRDLRDMGPINLIRQYVDNWEEVPRPADRRVIEAVQKNLDYRLGSTTTWTEYHKEFLKLAGASQLPSKDARQICEKFLAAVKADDQETILAVTSPRQGNWRERIGQLKKLPDLQRLRLAYVYADTTENLAQAMAVGPDGDNKDGPRVRIGLGFSSGAVWRVGNISIDTREIADRMKGRFLEKYPNAKPVPVTLPDGVVDRPLSVGRNQYLDLDTGKYVSMEGRAANDVAALKAGGVDLYLTYESMTSGSPGSQVKTFGMAVRDVPHVRELGPSAREAVAEALAITVAQPNESKWITGYSASGVWAFRTAAGSTGVLRVKWPPAGAPPQCNIEYTLLPQLDIPPEESKWGEAVKGVQCRLRPLRSVWRSDNPPELFLDIRNNGTQPIDFCRIAEAHCEIEVGGRWYGLAEPLIIDSRVWELKPGMELNEAIMVKLTNSWALPKRGRDPPHAPGIAEEWGKRLKLTAGKHAVRVRFRPHDWLQGYIKNESNLSVVSNYVGVESFDADEEDALWGEAVEGLRVRLRAEEPLQLTPTPTFRMDIRNHSENEYRLVLTPSSWEFNVNGKTYRGSTSHRGEPPMLTIGPREEHKGLLIPLDKEYGWQCGDEPLRFIHGRQTFAVTVKIDRLAPGGGSLRIASKPIELEVSSKVRLLPAWSRHIEGFQIRAHAAKYRWQIGQAPTFKAQVRNLGPHSALVPLVYHNGWEVEVDGKWHHCSIRNTALPYPLTPYTQHDNIAIELLPEWQGKPLWVGKTDKQPLKFSPGFHEIRIALPFGCKTIEGEDKPLRLLSEPFEIEIMPDAPKADELVWGEAVNGLRAALEFIPEKPSYGFGAKIGLRFHFQNVSDRNIQFISDTWRQEPRVIIEDENGKRLHAGLAVYSGMTPTERYYLKPGETTAIDSSALGIAADNEQAEQLGYPVGHTFICKPGIYFLRFPLIIPNVMISNEAEEPDFQGFLETGKREITVTAATDTDAASIPPKSRDGPDDADGMKIEAETMRVAVKDLLAELKQLEIDHIRIRKEKMAAMGDSQKQAFAARNMSLESGLEDKLKEVSDRTAKKLAGLGELAVPALLDELWSIPLEYYKRRSCIGRGLEQIGKPAVPYLIETLQGRVPGVKAEHTEYEKVITARCMYIVVTTLGKIRDARAVEPLLELFEKNKTASVRWISPIAAALGSIGDKRAVEPLISELDAALKRAADSNDWDTGSDKMKTYAEVLGRLGDKRAIEVLTEALRAGPQRTKPGKRYLIAEEAAKALQMLGVKVEGEDGDYHIVADSPGRLTAVGGKLSVVEVNPDAADILRRFWHSLEQSDWDAALALCSENVRKEAAKYPSPEAFFRAVVPVYEVIKQRDRPRTGSWPNPPRYFAYFFDVRIPRPGSIRDVWWVWKVRRLEGRTNWEIDFPTITFETWLAEEKDQIERAAKEHQRRIDELGPRFEGVKTVLSTERKEWVVGEPIYVNLELVNQSTSLLRYDDQQVAVNNSLTITDAKGRQVKYIAPLFQTMGTSKKIEPGQTHALLDRFDITEQYAIRKPGQYQVQFSGQGLQVGILNDKNADPEDPTSFIPYPDEMPSNVIMITVHSSIPDSIFTPDTEPGIPLEADPPVAKGPLVWGERANDLQAAVEFVPEGGTFSLGRKIGIRFHIRNVGRELRILGASKPFHDAVQCIITDSRGRRVSGSKNNYLSELMHVQRWLLPGQTVVFEGMPLGIAGNAEFSHPVGFVFRLKPGRYTLRYELGRMGGLATGSRPFVVTAARPSIAADEPHIADSAAEPEKPMLESKGRTSWTGAFELDKDIPAGLDCPAVRDKWRFYQRPLRIESMRFASKDGRLSCSFNICSAEVANGAFLVRLMIRGRQYRGSPDEVLLGAGEFLFKTRGKYSTLPRMSRESYELDVESMDRFRYAETFEIVIEDLSAVARRGERRPNITEFRDTYKENEPIGVNLDCPVVKDVWGNDSRPFKVESVEFVEKDGRLSCSVKLDGATTADGQFIIRVKIFGKDVSVPEAESILGLRGFLFETQCAYAGLPAVVRRTRNLDLGPIDRFTVATRFEVEIENVTERAGRGKVKS